MDYQGDIEALRALARDKGSPSKMSRIRAIFNEIEETQEAGVSNKLIVETLNSRGYDLTLKTFETILHRIRKEKDRDLSTTPNNPTTHTEESAPIIDRTPQQLPNDTNTRKIMNPATLKKARLKDLDLEDYNPPD